MARVTGSTAYNALGFVTLKAQKQHFDHVVKESELLPVDSSAAIRMKHGNENEINALATLVSKMMRVLFPGHCCYHIMTGHCV